MALRGNICQEPCTLVYTLLNPDELTFDEFSLIVRSLHSYMVEAITPNPESNNVHVKLSYQASLKNASDKLGQLQQFIHVAKLSAFIKDSELPLLERLRTKYEFGRGGDCSSGAIQPKPRRFRQNRGAKVFNPRPSPYQRIPAVPQFFDSETQEDGEQAFTATNAFGESFETA